MYLGDSGFLGNSEFLGDAPSSTALLSRVSDFATFIISFPAYAPGSGLETLRYAQKAFRTQPDDTPASVGFRARVLRVVLPRRDMWGDGSAPGRIREGVGEIILANQDGELDFLLTYGCDGRDITIYRGYDGQAFPATFESWTYTMDQPEGGFDEIRIRLRDKTRELDTPFQQNLYAGDNSLPNGLEGTSDLLAKPKPVLLGSVRNVTPVLVNSSKLIYQVNDGAIDGVTDVRDQGVSLTPAADYTTLADLQDDGEAPSSGEYRVYPAGGYFRLGSQAVGELTCDPVEGAADADRTMGQLFVKVLVKAGKTSSDYRPEDIELADAADSSVRGMFIQADRRTTASVISELVSPRGWWGTDKEGRFRIGVIEEPSGKTPVATFKLSRTRDLRRLPIRDVDAVPSYETVVRYFRNYTVQATGLAGSVTEANRALYQKEWIDAASTDSAVQTVHRLAPRLVYDTTIQETADAESEAEDVQDLQGAERARYEFDYPLDDASVLRDIGEYVELIDEEDGRFDLASGKTFLLTALRPKPASGGNDVDMVLVNVWG